MNASFIPVSIANLSFRLDTEAYNELSTYLDTLERAYHTTTDGGEIIADIEARIGELILAEQDTQQIVSQACIHRILMQMGLPEELPASSEASSDRTSTANVSTDSEKAPSSAPQSNSSHEATSLLTRRFYRNPQNAKLGGVCSGLATYFGVDPVWVRLIVLIPFLLVPIINTGVPSCIFLLLYFILWFVTPKARTPRQLLEMEGRPVTASSIQQTFTREFNPSSPSPKKQRNVSIWTELLCLLGRIGLLFVKCLTLLISAGLIICAITILVSITAAGNILSTVLSSEFNFGYLPFSMSDTFLFPYIMLAITVASGTLLMAYLLFSTIFQLPYLKQTAKIGGGIWLLLLLFTTIICFTRFSSTDGSSESFFHTRNFTVDSLRVEQIHIGDSVVNDTIHSEIFFK